MKVTVVPPDRIIIVDNKALHLKDEDWNFDDSHIHAIQWNGNQGEIEWITNDPNEKLDTIDIAQPYIDFFLSEIPKVEKFRLEREERERQEQQSSIDQQVEADRYKQDLIIKIKETAEENKRLSLKAFNKELEKDRLKNELANKEIELQHERKLKEQELEKIKIKTEIQIAEEKSLSEINLQKLRLEKEDKLFNTKREELNQAFKSMASGLASKVETLNQYAAEERELLDQEREDYLKKKKVTEKQLNAQLIQAEVSAVELEKTREELQQEFEIQVQNTINDREIDRIKHETSMQALELERVKLQNAIEETQAEKAVRLKELDKEQKDISNIETSLDLDRENIKLERDLLEKEREEFNKLIQIEKDNANMALYEERARIEAERLVDQKIRDEVERDARDIATTKVSEIAENFDPLLLFDQIASNPDVDLKNFPVAEILSWFSQLQRIKDFCIKYDLTYQQVQSSPELKEMCDEYIKQARHDD